MPNKANETFWRYLVRLGVYDLKKEKDGEYPVEKREIEEWIIHPNYQKVFMIRLPWNVVCVFIKSQLTY